MNDGVSLGVGSVVGAVVSELLKVVIEEAKMVLAFKSVYKDLASTMEEVLPAIIEIEKLQGAGELKNLNDIINEGLVLVRKCSEVKRWNLPSKAKYTRKVNDINKRMLKFCQIQLQLFLLRNQLLSMRGVPVPLMGSSAMSRFSGRVPVPVEVIESNPIFLTESHHQSINKKLDVLSVSQPVFSDLCSVPKIDDKVPLPVDKMEVIESHLQSINKSAMKVIESHLQSINKKLDVLSVSQPVFSDLCSVPKIDDKVLVGLDLPLMEVKKKLLDDDDPVVSLVVSAPRGCGKTTLVTQLCHDDEVKEKFEHIFFSVVSRGPNFRTIVQNLLQHNGYEAVTFENDSQALVGLRKLLEELSEDGPILLVLDDVWHGAESLLQKFQINIVNFKILVTSRFEFPSFGPTYHLKPLGDEDAKSLLIERASLHHFKNEDVLQKILERCKGIPLRIEVRGVQLITEAEKREFVAFFTPFSSKPTDSSRDGSRDEGRDGSGRTTRAAVQAPRIDPGISTRARTKAQDQCNIFTDQSLKSHDPHDPRSCNLTVYDPPTEVVRSVFTITR